ncbi:MAG TPA: DUF192 domain-containing protein [Polyangiaceae bacterium]|jgi:hypothetical protein
MRVASPFVLALVAAACGRTPPEDFSSPASSPGAVSVPVAPPAPVAPVLQAASTPASSGAAASAPAPPGRCVLATPALPPPPVAPGPAADCPADPEAQGFIKSHPPVARVTFPGSTDANAAPLGVEAEVVSTPHDTMRGLMFRKSMAEDRGMLFDLGTHEDHKFWMHNTCIPLDLLYIDDDGLIVGIVENAPTLNDEARGVGCLSSFVLEVNAGWARRHHVTAGQRLVLPVLKHG